MILVIAVETVIYTHRTLYARLLIILVVSASALHIPLHPVPRIFVL
jgi:hypothetical protein